MSLGTFNFQSGGLGDTFTSDCWVAATGTTTLSSQRLMTKEGRNTRKKQTTTSSMGCTGDRSEGIHFDGLEGTITW
ncbi:hypothetical protein [Coleofasciculus sp. FACHB-T130]|uniref:hypothetical protein n=1 Tax=Cyanophyceae TaxID=3028117 RepID=UPI001686A895|nr:hypothetical protein [Coleofasciculus sp. FACHB-T130]MBD1880164.1 hypothetical protein [Coleofasciculus sp. FACHB-T130]